MKIMINKQKAKRLISFSIVEVRIFWHSFHRLLSTWPKNLPAVSVIKSTERFIRERKLSLRMTLTVFSFFCSSVRVRIISSAKRLAKTMLTTAHADLHRGRIRVHYFIFGRLYGCHHLFETFLRPFEDAGIIWCTFHNLARSSSKHEYLVVWTEFYSFNMS